MDLDLIFSPNELRFKTHLVEKTAVVVDVLRATTTMTTACHNGCSSIKPVLTPEEDRSRFDIIRRWSFTKGTDHHEDYTMAR